MVHSSHRWWSLKRGGPSLGGEKQCKPKHVSSGIVVLNVRWSLIRVGPSRGEGTTVSTGTETTEARQQNKHYCISVSGSSMSTLSNAVRT